MKKKKDKINNSCRSIKGVSNVKKLIKMIVPMVCLVLVTGCQSKSEVNVFTILNDQIVKQNQCNGSNEQLTTLLNQETTIYNQIIDKGTNSFEDIRGLVEEGKENIEGSKQILSDYDLCIRSSLVDEAKLSKEIESIKDEKIKDDSILLTVQYKAYEESLTQYVSALIKLNEAQGAFYNGLNEATSVQTIEQLVMAINTAIDEANQASEDHREALVAFNELYSQYYESYIK